MGTNDPTRLRSLLDRIYQYRGRPPAPPIQEPVERLPRRSPSDPLYFFPHAEIRPVQIDFLQRAATAYTQRRAIVAHLPTGSGKTAIALAAALKTDAPKILYLINRQTQHAIVVRELDTLLAAGVPASYVDLISKPSMCCNEDALFERRGDKVRERGYSEFLDECTDLLEPWRKNPENPSKCEWFNRALAEDPPPPMGATALVRKAKNEGMCAYYWALQRCRESRVIIADYNLLLIPSLLDLTLQRAGVSLEEVVVVFDEAHNVPERVCDLHSRTMTAERINAAANDCLSVRDAESPRFLLAVEAQFRQATLPAKTPSKGRVVEQGELTTPTERSAAELTASIDRLRKTADAIKARTGMFTQAKPVAEFLEQWYQAWPQVRIAFQADTFARPPHARIELNVIDPKPLLKPIWERVRWAILMSGTLHPTDRFATHVGLDAEKFAQISAPSPFPRENRAIHHEDALSTMLKERNDQLYVDYAARVRRDILADGNVAVFAPSYAFAARLAQQLQGVRRHIIEERSAMKADDRARVLDHLRTTKVEGSLLVGVFRGGFSEGVDFPSGLLPQIFLVGLPVAWDILVEQTRAYYRRAYGPEVGDDLSVNIPAVRQAVQAAGRGVRGPTDKCSIHFLDRRYQQARFSRLLPEEYRPRAEVSA